MATLKEQIAPGRKFDEGKPRWSLFPPGTLMEICKVLTFGADKYQEDDNWMKVKDCKKRYYNAMNRHIEAWWQGEAMDQETGYHHLAHAGCCLLFLLWFELKGYPPETHTEKQK